MRILTILTASKDATAKKKAERKAKALKRKQESLIDSLEDKRDDLLSKKEELESVTMDSVNENSWCKEYHQSKIDLKLIQTEIDIAQEVLQEMFSEDVKKTKE